MVTKKLSSDLDLKVESVKPLALLVPAGELGAVVTLQIKDQKTGKVEWERKFVSHSFVKQFLQMLWIFFSQVSTYMGNFGDLLITDTAGVVQDGLVATSGMFDVTAVANDDTHGIQVGTDNTAETINDYVLGTLVAHGVGAGQLQYGAVAFGAPSDDGTTSQFTITRDFANNSGGTITVEEIGLVAYCGGYYLLMIHDTTGSINVLDGKTLTVNYQVQANV